MLYDRLENWQTYPLGKAWEEIVDFLKTLPPDAGDGEYPIRGEEIFARVMSYETRRPEDAVLETHRRYVDLQAVLTGEEILEWFPVAGLAVDSPYEEARDAAFYRRPGPPPARMVLRPGFFALLFPQDAHMPCLIAGDAPVPVRKVVVKIAVELLAP